MANGNGSRIWAIVASVIGAAAITFGAIEAAGNTQHRTLEQADKELERRIERVEDALSVLPDMQKDIAVIKDRVMGDRK